MDSLYIFLYSSMLFKWVGLTASIMSVSEVMFAAEYSLMSVLGFLLICCCMADDVDLVFSGKVIKSSPVDDYAI